MKDSSIIKIPPPIVTSIFAFFMFLISYFIDYEIEITGKRFGIVFLCVISFLLLFPAILQFYRSKTTVNPLKPENTKVLVIKGVYNYSRNPMYLGMAIILLAWCLYLQNPINLMLFIFFIFYMNHFQIKIEEQALEKIFGEDFVKYKERVRRWI